MLGLKKKKIKIQKNRINEKCEVFIFTFFVKMAIIGYLNRFLYIIEEGFYTTYLCYLHIL